jgi:hypothetical protein
MDRPVRSRILTATGWALTVALAVALGYQRYAEAIAGGPGADLGAWLDASELARSSGDIYDARGYTYSPLIAWLLLVFPDPVSAMAGWTALSLALGPWPSVSSSSRTARSSRAGERPSSPRWV